MSLAIQAQRGGGFVPATGELLNLTFTAGNTQKWYSRRGGENFGIITSGSAVVLGAGFSIDRIWERGASTFQLSQTGGVFSDWILLYPDATFVITHNNGIVTYTVAGLKTVGSSFITWRPTAAEQLILASVAIGDEVNLVISTP